MRRFLLFLSSVSLACVLVSCEKPGEKTPPVKSPPSDTAKPAPEIPSDLKKATARAGEAGKEVAATAKDITKDLSDAAAALDAGFSVEKLKGMVGSLSTDKLTSLAEKLSAAIKDEQGNVKRLQDQSKDLGIADAPRIQQTLSTALDNLKVWKDKLKVVVDELRARGVDISKYTDLLGAP